MKGRVVAIEARSDGAGNMAALLVDGQLEDLLIDPAETDTPQPGAIYRAVLDRPIKGMHGAIVKLGNGYQGFLKETKGLTPGEPILVQVNTHADPGKATPVTTRLIFKSRYAIVTPGAPGLNIARKIRDDDERDRLNVIAREMMDGAQGLGLVLRSACEGTDDSAIADDIETVRGLAEDVLAEQGREPELLVDAPGAAMLAWRDWAEPTPDIIADNPGSFNDHWVWDAIDTITTPREALGPQAWMSVESTSALIAVDVNTGGDFSPAAALKANLAAVKALPRALRLRGLGGQIVIDMAPVSKKHRIELEAAIRRAFKFDAVDTQFVGWTPLGNVELLRKRERLPLREVLPK